MAEAKVYAPEIIEQKEEKLQLPATVEGSNVPDIIENTGQTGGNVEQLLKPTPVEQIAQEHNIDAAQLFADIKTYFTAIQTSSTRAEGPDDIVTHMLTDEILAQGDEFRTEFLQNITTILGHGGEIRNHINELVDWIFSNIIQPALDKAVQQFQNDTNQTGNTDRAQRRYNMVIRNYQNLGATPEGVRHNLYEFFQRRFFPDLESNTIDVEVVSTSAK